MYLEPDNDKNFRDTVSYPDAVPSETEEMYQDPTHVGEIEKEIVEGEKDSISIKYATFLRQKVFGVDVRESMARFVLWISVQYNKLFKKQGELEDKHTHLELRYDTQLAGKTDISEVIDGRVSPDGVSHKTLKKRLDSFEMTASHAISILESKKADQAFVDAQFTAIVSGAPKGTFNTLQALKNRYPNGTEGIFLVLDNGHWYYWNANTSLWTDGGLYQSMELSDKSVSRNKLNDRLLYEMNLYATNNLENNFELLNNNFFQLGTDMYWYTRCLGSVRKMIIKGFDSTKEHRLRFIARNHSAFRYRFIICSRNDKDSPWVDVFDSGRDFFVTENNVGLTTVFAEIGTKSVVMLIDYSNIDFGDAINDGMLGDNDGRYKLKQECFYQNSIEYLKKSVTDIEEKTKESISKDIVLFRNGSSIKVKYKKNNHENEIVDFDKLGINEITHIKRLYKEKSTKLTLNFDDIELYYTLYTDWISPYQNVKALSGGINSFTGTVGGNHGTNGAGGFPTAKNLETICFVDGKLVYDQDIISGKSASIVVKNVISAPNKINLENGDKSESMLETVTYNITPNNISISVTLKALEDVEIGGYVGFQMTTDVFKNASTYFLDKPIKYVADGVLHNSESLPFKNDRMVMENGIDGIITYTNRTIGLGDLSKKADKPIYFLSEFDKLYGHLLGEKIVLNKGQVVYYSGGYTLINKIECEGSEFAYFIVENNEKIYCIDFFKAVDETFLKLSEDLLGKTITVIDSINVESEKFISGEGLKVKSTGLGFIKLKINS